MTLSAFTAALDRSHRRRLTLLAGAFFFLLFARRFAQLLYPQVWDEDGAILTDLVQSGPLAILHPLNGYLVIVPKLISFLAILFPLPAFAFIGTVITWAFIVGVLVAITISPTVLKGGALLALAVILIPSNPEAIGVSLYTLWWAPLLLVSAAFWKPDANGQRWRIAFAILGGLSAPLVAIVAPIAIARAIYEKKRTEVVFAAICVACTLVQGLFVVLAANDNGSSGFGLVVTVFKALPEFIGTYPVGNIWVHGSSLRGWVELVLTIAPLVMIAVALRVDSQQRVVIAGLTFLWLASIVLTCGRTNPGWIDPATNGPRYFFYAFIFEAWILSQILFTSSSITLRRCAAVPLVLAAFNVLPVLSRTHDDLDWKEHVAQCAAMPGTTPYAIPTQYDGHAAKTLSVTLTGSECRRMSHFGLIGLLVHG